MAFEKILIAADQFGCAGDLQEILKEFAYKVVDIVPIDQEMAARVKEVQPDLIIMDISNDEKTDGIQIADQIQKTLDIPTIYLLEHTDDKILDRINKTEHYGFIIKPFSKEELHCRIDTALIKHKKGRKLRENQAWISTTLKSIGDAVITTDQNGLVNFLNPIAENLTGWTLADAKDRKLDDVFQIVDELTNEPVHNPAEKILRDGVIIELTNHTMLVAKDGKHIPIDDSGAPIKDNRGNILGAVIVFRDVTERRRIRDALTREKDLLHAIMDTIPDTIYFKDTAGRFLRVSKAKATKHGLEDPEKAVGRTDFDFFSKQHAQETSSHEQEIIKSGRPVVGIEEKETWPDGRETWVSTTKMPFRDRHGNIIGTFGVSRDITERKQAEEALELERNLLKTVIDNIPDKIYAKDTEGRFIICNKAVASRMGVSDPNQVVGKSDFDFLPSELAAQFHSNEQDIIKSGQALINHEEPLDQLSGGVRWNLATKVPLRDMRGNIIGIVGMGRDITDRKRIEEALRKSEEKYRKQFEETIDAIFVVNTETGIIVDCNRSASELVGREKLEIIGQHQRILHPPEEIEGDRSRTFKQHLKEKEGQILETQILTKKGEIRDVAVKASIFEIEGQKVLLGIFRDITDSKLAEEALRNEKALMDALMDNIPDSIYFKDRQCRLLRINKRMMQTVGIQHQSEYFGKTDSELYGKEFGEKTLGRDRLLMETGKPIIGLVESRNLEDGQINWTSTTKVPIYDGEGKIIGLVGITREINEIKQAEAEREKIILELQDAIRKVNTLKGLIPICANCKKIRDDQGYWSNVESYIADHAEVEFTHGICPDCLNKLYPEYSQKIMAAQTLKK